MKRLVLLPVCAAAFGLTLPGCGGGGAATPTPFPTATAPGGIACVALAFIGPVLVAPVPGATGVSPALAVLTFGPMGNVGDTLTGSATLTGTDGSTLVSGPLTPAADFKTSTASISGLHAHTTYLVNVGGTFTDHGCTYPFNRSFDTFTTL